MSLVKFTLTNRLPRLEDARSYVLHDGLVAAVKVAMALDKPLLLMGEPGTGKTKLAYKLAADLADEGKGDFGEEPLRFNCKAGSEAKDVLYRYDAVRRFHDAHSEGGKLDVMTYIVPRALGKAIALTNVEEAIENGFLHEERKRQSSVVLIDEIDKAPKDFANALLDVLEEGKRRFWVDEAGIEVVGGEGKHRVFVVITSNGERPLPEAFLRRCVFYHIPFPSSKELLQIVGLYMGKESEYYDEVFIDMFLEVRRKMDYHRPATASLIEWLRVLELEGITKKGLLDEGVKGTIVRTSLGVLVKTVEDLRKVEG